jgi:hypothetical protein
MGRGTLVLPAAELAWMKRIELKRLRVHCFMTCGDGAVQMGIQNNTV